MGICVFFVWMTNFLIGLTFPVLLSLGLYIAFFIFVAIGIISMIFVKLCVPETKGHSLEELEHRFRNYKTSQIYKN